MARANGNNRELVLGVIAPAGNKRRHGVTRLFFAGFPIGLVGLCLGFLMPLLSPQPSAQNIRSREESAAVLAIANLTVQNGAVAGELLNRTNHEVRDVQLFIRYTWLWDDERNPGQRDPGRSTYHTLNQSIPPAGKIRFTYQPSPPLPQVGGGRFDISASVAGYSEIFP